MLTFAIGDIHGCFDQLEELVNDCLKVDNDYYIDLSSRKRERPMFIFVGDYVDRGPDSRKVIDYLINMPHQRVCLKGNHEDMLIKAHDNSYEAVMWLRNGGYETQESYAEFAKKDGRIDPVHLEWMRQLPTTYQDKHRIFVHAGLDPLMWETHPGLENQLPHDLMWIRNPFLQDHTDYGKLVVHGHTPAANVVIKPYRICIDSACVFGSMLTAAVFDDKHREPLQYLQVKGPQRK